MQQLRSRGVGWTGELRVRKSEIMPSAAITGRVGVEPDAVQVRGSRRPNPPLPVCHSWAVECRTSGLAVDEQIARVLTRIRPAAEPNRSLTASGVVCAVLHVVRNFDDDDGESEQHEPVSAATGRSLERLTGQHDLLCWHLTSDDLAFLASLPADLDIDDYG